MDLSIVTIWFPVAAAGWVMLLLVGIHDAIVTRNDTHHGETVRAVLQDMLEWKHRAQRYETMLRQNNLLPVDPWNAPLPGHPAPWSRPLPLTPPAGVSGLARPSLPSRPLTGR